MAAKNPLPRIEHPLLSTYVPNTAVIFYILNYMDFIMTFTYEWTLNSAEWAPPVSQIYVGILCYVQIIRAMISGGNAPDSLKHWFKAFSSVNPLEEFWIPGPLVSAIKAISAFEPFEDHSLGVVTPALSELPGFNEANNGTLGHNLRTYLPSISVYLDRYHQLIDTASKPGMTEQLFLAHLNGPRYRTTVFGATVPQTTLDMVNSCPGAGFMDLGSLALWRTAASHRTKLGLPAQPLTANFNGLQKTWEAVMFLDKDSKWLGAVTTVMARYCKFWNGSTTLDACSPSSSAAAALKVRIQPAVGQNVSIFTLPSCHVHSGAGTTTRPTMPTTLPTLP